MARSFTVGAVPTSLPYLVNAKRQQIQMEAIFTCDLDISFILQCRRSVACSEYLTKCPKQGKHNFDNNMLGVSWGVREVTIPSTAEGRRNHFHLGQWNALSDFVTYMGSPG